MPSNVQIRRIFSFLDDLMMLLRFANGVLLGLDVVGKTFVARLIFAADFRDIPFDRRQFFFAGREFLLGKSRSFCATHASPNQFSSLLRQSRATSADAGDLRFQVGWWRIQ